MVEAQIVREVEQEPAANDKPETWIAAEAVWLPTQPGRLAAADSRQLGPIAVAAGVCVADVLHPALVPPRVAGVD